MGAYVQKKRFVIPDVLKKLYAVFSGSGFEAYLVGGAVRDTFLGKTASDYDIATNASPNQVTRMFSRVIPTGIDHGTVTVLFLGRRFEVTTFRKESGYTDGRHPDAVFFDGTIEDDLSRRDFTVNAVAVNLKDGTIVDPFDGRRDMEKKIVRTVGSPLERFTEDGLRPIRAIRFSACLDFEIDAPTLDAIPLALGNIKSISIERFRDEFIKILGAAVPSTAFGLLENCKIFEFFIPELMECREVSQSDERGFHCFDVLDHLYYSCDGAPQDNLSVRLAALFHDIAKPRAAGGINELRIAFYGHEKLGARMAEEILLRLRFPKQTIAYVSHLIAEHMFCYESVWTDAAIRRFIARVSPEAISDLFDLRVADFYGKTRKEPPLAPNPWKDNLVEFKKRIQAELNKDAALTLKDLAINGDDLRGEGIPQGKLMGTVLSELLETVLDDPRENERAHLILLAKNIYARLAGDAVL
jgi:putative nucleotidyltransferase with HDIG domain